MLVGILSDTHGDARVTAQAVHLLGRRGAQFLVHCGDIGDRSVLDHLAGLPAAAVWGNCDFDRAGLQRYAQNLGIGCYGGFGELLLDGKRIALLHGDDHRLRQRLLAAQEYDYLLQGHTHIASDEQVGRTRLLNPGALYRARFKTVALLDPGTGQVEFCDVEAPLR